ncbi:protein fem-1 homolog B-like [Mytilus edulis]|uniref:protein fem-1 homolog B-like n=1 Tax=Mytilus edulis TaxID=6550 RepID=UPI0039EF2B4A
MRSEDRKPDKLTQIPVVGGWTALTRAAIGGHVEVCQLLLENKCNKDITQDRGYTALMSAASGGHVEVCRLLLENKCNKDITDEYGRTALMFAASRGHVEVCQLLLENKCHKDITDSDGSTALHLAAEWGQLQTTRCLVEEAGISPLVKTHKGKTPYDLAASMKQGQYKEVMEYLKIDDTLTSSGTNTVSKVDDTITSGGTKYSLLGR